MKNSGWRNELPGSGVGDDVVNMLVPVPAKNHDSSHEPRLKVSTRARASAPARYGPLVPVRGWNRD